MFKYDSLINKCQSNGIPNYNYDGYIRDIIMNLSNRLSDGDFSIVKNAVQEYKLYKFIKNIIIDRSKCIVEYDDGIISFNIIPKNFYNLFCDDIFKIRKLNGNCHYVTEKALEECMNSSEISAVTSLCISTNYKFFFHSYICDRKNGKIIDFARNIIMDKDDFDRFFCFYEINNLNYSEYMSRLQNSDYCADRDNVYSLLYLACEKLADSNIDIDELVSDKIGMTK